MGNKDKLYMTFKTFTYNLLRFASNVANVTRDKIVPAVKIIAAHAGHEIMRLTGLRQRHVFTRDNRLRLRYSVMPAVFVVAGTIILISFSTRSEAINTSFGNISEIEQTAAALDAETQERISELLNGSRYGQLSLASAALQAIPKPVHKTMTIESGDALGLVMQKAGVGGTETNQAIEALSDHFDPRQLKVGQNVEIRLDPNEQGEYRLANMKIEMDPIKAVLVSRSGDDFISEVHEKKVEKVVRANAAEIEVSLYGSSEKAGIPRSIIAEAIRIYSWNVDFQRDIRRGDKIELLYETYETEDGYMAKPGNILYANLTLGGKEVPLYRFDMEDGRTDYFGRDGISIKRTLMATPVDGARISSGYGMRRHPVLGYNKMHKGMDFAAPTGTPIYAAGDGVVERANRFSSYGNYIRIRHNSTLKTAYAHLHKFAKGIGAGSRVKQGDVIGYVGSTGRSTGPHLHYEVILNGKQVNPRSVDLPTGEELKGNDLKKFKGIMREFDMEYAALTKSLKYAQKEHKHDDESRYN